MTDWPLLVFVGIIFVTQTCHLVMDIQDARRKNRGRHG